MGEIQALSEILMGDLPSQSVFSLEPVFMCNSSLKQTSEEGNRDIVGSWVVAFFFFLRGKGVTIVGLFCFSTVIGNLFFSIYYTCSYSFFFFKTDLTYIKRPKTSRIKPGFLWFSFWPWASPLSPSAVTKLLPTSCARCWGQPEAGCMPPLRSTLLASVLQNHPQTATTCTEVGWTFRDKTLALAVWSTVDSGLPVIPVYR